MDIQEGDMVRFHERLLGHDIVDEGEVVETPPWSYKTPNSVHTYEDSFRVRVSSVGYLPVPPEQIKEVDP